MFFLMSKSVLVLLVNRIEYHHKLLVQPLACFSLNNKKKMFAYKINSTLNPVTRLPSRGRPFSRLIRIAQSPIYYSHNDVANITRLF